ncbi:unnamed protein product, partial [Rotaria sp. Silwood2]
PKEDKSKPAELNSTQIPSNTPVSRIEITIIHTTDDESPKGVVSPVSLVPLVSDGIVDSGVTAVVSKTL